MSEARLQLIEDHLKRNYIENGRFPCSTAGLLPREMTSVSSAAAPLINISKEDNLGGPARIRQQ
jgi:hypothetical protein